MRGILDARCQAEASHRHRAIDTRGFGAQAFANLPKIREWDELLRMDPQLRRKVREIHPEVSLAALRGGKGLREGKKTSEGASLRRRLLSPSFGERSIADLLLRVSRRLAATDDVLDALVALWSAERILRGESRTLPEPAMIDSCGFAAAIHY